MKGWKTLPNEQASGDFVWEYTRNNNCYLVHNHDNNGLVLSRDPLNLSGFNLKRDSGLAATQAIGIQLTHVKGTWKEKKVKKTGQIAKFNMNIKTKKINPRSVLRPVNAKHAQVTCLYSVRRNQTLTQVVKTLVRGLTNYRRDLKTVLAQRIRKLNNVKRHGVQDYLTERKKNRAAKSE
jgi:hypothetical protein